MNFKYLEQNIAQIKLEMMRLEEEIDGVYQNLRGFSFEFPFNFIFNWFFHEFFIDFSLIF